MRIFGLGAPELAIILIVVLLIFGPKNLPKLGALLGKGVKNLRDGLNDGDEENDEATDETVEKIETPVLEEEETPKRKVKVVKKTTEETVESEDEE